MLEPPVRRLAEGPNLAALTTILKSGAAQTHMMWVSVSSDGSHLLINTEMNTQKARNIQREPRVTLMIWDHDNPYAFVEVRGRVVDTVKGPVARAHIDELSWKYTGRPYPDQAIQSDRVMFKIKAERQLNRGA